MDPLQTIRFDRRKRPEFDFDIVPLEYVFKLENLDHDPRRPHKVQFYVLLLITAGTGKHTIDFIEYNYTKGAVLTIRKDQVHHFHDSEAKGFLLLFTEEYVLSYQEQRSADKIPELFNELLFNQHTQLDELTLKKLLVIVRQILEEFHQPADGHTSGIIRNLLQVLISKIHRLRSQSTPKSLKPNYLNQFLAFQKLVEAQCQTHRSVQYFADQLHLTPRTLNNITRATVDKSAKQFIDAINILQIKRKLINSTLSIKEIAYARGFQEPTNFFKYFKRFTGHTPESFRSVFTQ